MDRMKVWPHAILIIVACAVIGGAAALFWTKYERSAQASALPNAARIERVDGQVGLNRSLDNQANSQWIQATPNTPISVGDRIYTRDNSRSEVAFTGRDFATIDADTSLDILDLSNQRTQLALRNGSALFDVGSLASGELFEVATPCGAVDLQQPGLYQVGIDNNGNASATALSGRAQLVGNGGSSTVEKGETLTLPCSGGSAAALSRVDANQAGAVVDNYYRYRYPRRYDGRYRSYYTYLDDPNYYDPSRNYSSYNYVSDYVPGIDDLDDYGDWQNVSNYGYCWHPRVDASWAPYQSGYWQMDYPYGLTWVSNEPWGYAPYHYGRWTYSADNWFWVPEPVRTYPTYSPALVAFIPLGESSAAWVALGPGDPYAPRYYDSNWQPVYLTETNVIQERIVNLDVPGAVTVVPAQDFTRVIDRSVITRVDPQTITRVQPVLDPLTVDPLRRAAFETRAAQRRLDVPPVIARQINTPVVTTSAPSARPFRRDLAEAMRVQQIGEKRNNTLQVRDNRAPVANQPSGQPAQLAAEQAREKQIADLSRQAARGDRAARQQMQTLQRQQAEQQRADRFAAQQAQGERVRQQMQTQNAQRQQQQAQREAARQQMITNQQQQRHAATQQQQRQPQIQRPPQQVIRHAEQQQRVQPQPQRRRPPEQNQPQTQRQAPVQRQAPAPQQLRPQVERRVAPERVRPPQAQPAPAPVRVKPEVRSAPAPARVKQPQPQAQPERQPQPAKQPPGQRKKPPEKE